MGRIVKLAAVMTTAIVLLLAVVIGGPASMAQDDPQAVPATDQDMPATPCPQAADVPPDEVMDGDTSPTCTPDAAADAPAPIRRYPSRPN